MNSKLKIIKFFAGNKDGSFSINSVAKKLSLNYRVAFESIKQLEYEKVLSIKKLGNTNHCSFNYHFNEDVYVIETKKRGDLLKNKDIKVLCTRINEIQNPFFIVLLFGSYAKGIQTKHSDIDICIIINDKEIEQKIEQMIRTLPLKIHLLNFNTNEFIGMLKTTDKNVGKEIIQNNVILKNPENFYELINYARR